MNVQTLIVMPTINERPNLETLLPATLDCGLDCGVLVVDDGSTDGTPELAEQLGADTGRVAVLRRDRPMGLGKAYVDGFRYALANTAAQFIIEMDGDWSHDPKYLADFDAAARNGADVVIGSRYLDGISVVNWDLTRLILSKFGSWYARTITGLPQTDATAGFKCFRREVLETLDLDTIRSNGYSFQIEMSYRAWVAGFRLQEIPIVFTDRTRGESKITYAIVREAVWRCWALRLRHAMGGFAGERRR